MSAFQSLIFLGIVSTAILLEIGDDRATEAIKNSKVLLSKFAEDGTMDTTELLALYNSIQLLEPKTHHHGHEKHSSNEAPVIHAKWCNRIKTNSSCSGTCVVTDEVYPMYGSETGINSTSLFLALPALLMAKEQEYCMNDGSTPGIGGVKHRQKPSKKEVWGYGTAFVVCVCLISNLGAFLGPMIDTTFFKKLLMFLVSVAVGTLIATGLIVLVPESMNLMAIPSLRHNNLYIWRTTTVLGGILFFYLSERILKIVFALRKSKKARVLHERIIEDGKELKPLSISTEVEADDDGFKHGHSHLSPPPIIIDKAAKKGEKKPIQTIAWMMLLGDGIHKIIDGLSIGAAYSQSVATGLSLSIAIICEELPHELGDIAILLHAGMPMKKALFFNTLTAAAGFLGLAIGIVLGDITSASQWIFAVAGGIFLYVPLVDMLPEMSEAADKSVRDEGASPIAVTLIQFSGLVLGIGVILIVAIYAGDIQV